MNVTVPARQKAQLPGSGSVLSHPNTREYQLADRSRSWTARTGFEPTIRIQRILPSAKAEHRWRFPWLGCGSERHFAQSGVSSAHRVGQGFRTSLRRYLVAPLALLIAALVPSALPATRYTNSQTVLRKTAQRMPLADPQDPELDRLGSFRQPIGDGHRLLTAEQSPPAPTGRAWLHRPSALSTGYSEQAGGPWSHTFSQSPRLERT